MERNREEGIGMAVRRKRILITGASSGLGEGMAREFARLGCDLALCARRVDRLDALRAELAEGYPGIRVAVRELDVNGSERVFEVFRAFREDLGGLDRVIVNAGVGAGRRIGTGHHGTNLRTAQTNFVAALAQCEAAVGIFREQNAGHLVVISSVSAVRGMPRHLTAYAASKAGLTTLAEGIRAELLRTPIRVSTMFPGYIRTEMNADAGRLPFEVDAAMGARALVAAIEREPAQAFVPRWPWALVGRAMRTLPLSAIARWV
jgi:short-subunit dehydrogenase